MQINGYFNANNEPVIKLDLGTGGLEILVDTGFNGSLMLSNSLIAGLPLEFEGFVEFQTAIGQVFIAATYSLEIEWLGQRTRVAVAVTDFSDALLGGDMLMNCLLAIDYYERTVTITRRK